VGKKRKKKYATIKATKPASAAKAAKPAASKSATPRKRPGEFQPDYGYVVKDLKRIAILAGSFLVLLVVLSFVLR
jgi:hypothetical protein